MTAPLIFFFSFILISCLIFLSVASHPKSGLKTAGRKGNSKIRESLPTRFESLRKKKVEEKEAKAKRKIINSITEFDHVYSNHSVSHSVKEAVVIYQTHQLPSGPEIEGAADFQFAPKMSHLLHRYFNYSREKVNIVVVGLNYGDLLRDLVECLPNSSYNGYGFEIDKANFVRANSSLHTYEGLHLFQIGISNHSGEMAVGGAGQTAGLYDEKQVLSSMPFLPAGKKEVVEIMPLLKFVDKVQMKKVHYLTIDVEGHETCVLQGMQLDSPANQKMFSMFQMELGGTWVVEDPRHPVGSWTQYETMVYLEKLGYKLYLIGMRVLLPVTSLFFKYGPISGERDVIFGNVFVIHKTYADPIFLKYAQQYDDYEYVKQVLLVTKYPRSKPDIC